MKRENDDKALPLWRLLLMLLAAVLIPGCAGPLTYEQMYAEAEATGDWEDVREFERDVESADQFFMLKHACLAESTTVWFCDYRNSGQSPLTGPAARDKFSTLEAKVRAYRAQRRSCGCAKREEVFGR